MRKNYEESDWRLIQRFVSEDSQAAFASLVRRYTDIVYCTCVRELRDTSLAEEATQAAFLILARKAHSFRSQTTLSSWLFQTALYTARNARRQEQRRLVREQKVASQMPDPYPDAPSDWEAAEQSLNAALTSLSDAEQSLIMQRFWEDSSLLQIGTTLGITEDAARMRVNRALEKLRRYFAGRNLILPASVLAALLPQAIHPAPAHCAEAILHQSFTPASIPAGPSAHSLAQEVIAAMQRQRLKLRLGIGALVVALTIGTVGLVRLHAPAIAHAFAGVFGEPEWKLVPGPETPGLSVRLHGTIIVPPGGGRIDGYSFPSGKTILIRPDGPPESDDVVAAVAGPDRAGHVAYIEALQNSSRLSVTSFDGKHTHVVFTRPGFFYGDDDFGYSYALSPVGNQFAFFSNLKSRQMENPQLLLTDGTLELWDTVHDTKRVLPVHANDSGLAWFPDGRHLAYVQLDPNPGGAEANEFGPDYTAWPVLPVTYLLDTVTGKKRRLGIGWYPVVFTDGTRVLVHDGQYHPRLMTPTSHGSFIPVSVPGLFSFVFALDGDLVVYSGYPTFGRPRHTTDGITEMPSVKVAVINTHQFQTIIPYEDARRPISFGVPSRGL
jgi:RNA polymerase sigma factor (sigma-70 family)